MDLLTLEMSRFLAACLSAGEKGRLPEIFVSFVDGMGLRGGVKFPSGKMVGSSGVSEAGLDCIFNHESCVKKDVSDTVFFVASTSEFKPHLELVLDMAEDLGEMFSLASSMPSLSKEILLFLASQSALANETLTAISVGLSSGDFSVEVAKLRQKSLELKLACALSAKEPVVADSASIVEVSSEKISD